MSDTNNLVVDGLGGSFLVTEGLGGNAAPLPVADPLIQTVLQPDFGGDIKLFFDALEPVEFNREGDFVVKDNDLVRDPGLETAIVISLFTDRRVQFDKQEPPSPEDRRGWWGDNFNEPGDFIGSRLWTLNRAKMKEDEILSNAEDFIREALQWMIDDGIIDTLGVTVTRLNNDTLRFVIQVARPKEVLNTFHFNWKFMEAA